MISAPVTSDKTDSRYEYASCKDSVDGLPSNSLRVLLRFCHVATTSLLISACPVVIFSNVLLAAPRAEPTSAVPLFRCSYCSRDTPQSFVAQTSPTAIAVARKKKPLSPHRKSDCLTGTRTYRRVGAARWTASSTTRDFPMPEGPLIRQI